MANVSVSNTTGLYIGSGASAVLNSAQQLLTLLSNQGNVNFALATGNTQVQGYFIGNTGGGGTTYSNANVAAYLPVNSANVAGSYFIGDGSQLTNLPIGPSNYGNANVAAYLPTYTGSLALSSTIIDLYSNAATQATSINTTNANLGAYQTYANANAASQATSINTINANLGAFETYANATFGTSNYSNVNVAAYLPTYTGSLALSSTIVDLYSNAASQQTSIDAINANLGAFQTYSNVTNAATQANIGTLFLGNASTNANLGAFQTYANATFGTSSYSNVQVAAFLPTYSGNIGNVNIKSGNQYHYGGNLSLVANVASAVGSLLVLNAGNAASEYGGRIGLNASNVQIGTGSYASDNIYVSNKMEIHPGLGQTGNILTVSQGNVNLINNNNAGGGASNTGGYLFASNNISAAGNVNATYLTGTGVNTTTATITGQLYAGNIATANGLFWANGVNYSSTIVGQYSNANVSAFLVTSTSIITNSNTGLIRIQNTGNIASIDVGRNGSSDIGIQAYTSGPATNGNLNLEGYAAVALSASGVGSPGNVAVTGNYINFGQLKFGATANVPTGNTEIRIQGNTISNGNITAPFFIGDGSQLTNIPGGTYGNTQVAAFLPTYTGNIAFEYNTANEVYFTGANLWASGNVNSINGVFNGDGSGLYNISAAPYGVYTGGGTIENDGFQVMVGPGIALTTELNAVEGPFMGISSYLVDGNIDSGNIAYQIGGNPAVWYGGLGKAINGFYVPAIQADYQSNVSVTGVNIFQQAGWGNVHVVVTGADNTGPYYKFSNVGLQFPDGTVQTTANSSTAGSNFTSNLTVNGNYILDANLNIIKEKFANIGSLNGVTTIDANVAIIQAAVVASNITINTNNLTNLGIGQTITVKLTQATNANLRLLTSNIKFAGASKTLSTANAAIDTLTITYDGETYLGALIKGYA